jgi:hypothetical protein
MEMNWSRWFRCESSFGLLLVPNQPGVFALAEEVIEPAGANSRRMLAVFQVDETEDLALSLSRLFAVGSPWREKLAEGHCYARYAVAPGLADRRAAADALRQWLDTQRELATQMFAGHDPMAQKPGAAVGAMRSERRIARAEYEGEAAARCGALAGNDEDDAAVKTVAERAVDRVARGGGYAKMLRAR